MLDANQLEALAAVLEHGSFGAAARSLNLTLAAVSLRIRSLETRLGQRLLVRGKTVRATPAGRALQGHVKQLRLMEADLIADMQGSEVDAESAWKSLAVAVNADSLSSWFLPGMAALLGDGRRGDAAIAHDAEWFGEAALHRQRLRAHAAENLTVPERFVRVVLVVDDEVEQDAMLFEQRGHAGEKPAR